MKQNWPKIDFSTFLLSISSAALYSLGVPLPMAPVEKPPQEGPIDLPLARQNIDLLELLSEKTKGNLTADEAKLLQQVLFELRMRFIEIEKSQGKT